MTALEHFELQSFKDAHEAALQKSISKARLQERERLDRIEMEDDEDGILAINR